MIRLGNWQRLGGWGLATVLGVTSSLAPKVAIAAPPDDALAPTAPTAPSNDVTTPTAPTAPSNDVTAPVQTQTSIESTHAPSSPLVPSAPQPANPQPWVNPSLAGSKPFGRGLSVGLMLGMYVGINIVAYFAWWQGKPPDQFEWIKDGWFGEHTYAGGSDKFGHYYANHLQTRAVAGILEEGGWHPRTSTYAGAALTTGTFYVIEMRDAFTTGFSKNDMISNLAGAATGVLFREFPVLDKYFDTRLEYIPSSGYFKHFKKQGLNFAEDYTGMTYHFAWHLCSLPFIEQLPGPLRFADLVVGYGTRNYRPRTDPSVPRYQETFIGISLNVQRIVDELWMGERHPKWGSSASRLHRFTHFATEFLSVPYTTLPLGTWENVEHRQAR